MSAKSSQIANTLHFAIDIFHSFEFLYIKFDIFWLSDPDKIAIPILQSKIKSFCLCIIAFFPANVHFSANEIRNLG